MQKTRLASLLLLGVIVSIALSSSLAFAQATNSTALTPDTSGIPPIGAGLAKWFIAVIWASIGFAVAKANGEKFDPLNFGVTILIGFVLCILTTVGNLDPNMALALVGVLTPILDKLLGKKTASQKTSP